MLLAAMMTMLLVWVTSPWLPLDFMIWLRRFFVSPGPASPGDRYQLIIVAGALYVLCMCMCGVTIAAALIAVIRRVWQLAER